MYYSSGNYEAFARPEKPEGVDHKSAYLIGSGLAKDSIVLTEQIRTLDKRRRRERAGRIPEDDMRRVDEALGVSMGLHDQPVAQSTHMDGGYF